jgi:apolipoprotein D and lipocalin family protein
VKTHVGKTSVLRRYLIGALAVGLLAACEPAQNDVVLKTVPTFRDPTVNIGVTTRFDPARFAGDWTVVARFAETGKTPARDTIAVTFDRARSQFVLLSKDGAQRFGYEGRAVLQPKSGEPLVVMWIDEGFRTAALGTPSGRIGYILDRNKTPSADRFKAAREILTFYGWDISHLQRTR